MSKSQRTKGAVGEREVCDLFSAALGLAEGPCFCGHEKSEHNIAGEARCHVLNCQCTRYKNKLAITRNIGQSRDGGYDVPVEDLAVEVKRRKTLGTIYGWLQQAFIGAKDEGANRTPIVVCRQDGGEWIVVLRLTDFLKYWLGWRVAQARAKGDQAEV